MISKTAGVLVSTSTAFKFGSCSSCLPPLLMLRMFVRSYIAKTNGYSNGIMPMLRAYDVTARYVDQGCIISGWDQPPRLFSLRLIRLCWRARNSRWPMRIRRVQLLLPMAQKPSESLVGRCLHVLLPIRRHRWKWSKNASHQPWARKIIRLVHATLCDGSQSRSNSYL